MFGLEKRKVWIEELASTGKAYKIEKLYIPYELAGFDFYEEISDANQRRIAEDIMQSLGFLDMSEYVPVPTVKFYVQFVFTIAFDLRNKAKQGTLTTGKEWFREFTTEQGLLSPYMNFCIWQKTGVSGFKYSDLFDAAFFRKYNIDARKLVTQGQQPITKVVGL